jgi:hypothetical protein
MQVAAGTVAGAEVECSDASGQPLQERGLSCAGSAQLAPSSDSLSRRKSPRGMEGSRSAPCGWAPAEVRLSVARTTLLFSSRLQGMG